MTTSWESVPYHELKRVCAQRGISGKGKKEELVARLEAADGTAPASNGPAGGSSEPAKEPVKGDGLAGAAAHVVDGLKDAAAAGVAKAKEAADVAKAHLLPLPAEGGTTPKPAASRRRQVPERLEMVPVIPWASFLLLALLGSACGFAFLLIAHPQAPALRAQAFKLSQAVVADAKARSNYAVVKTKAVTSHGWEYMIVRMERACLGVYHAAAYVGAAFQEAFPRGRSACRRSLQAAVLEHLIPPDAPGAAHELASAWPPPEGAIMKGTGLLLGCASPPVCDALYGPFKRKFAKGPCASCVLHITDKQLAGVDKEEVAGLLQQKLARFLRRCPDGVVLVDGGAIQPHEKAVMPLITALSERSTFALNGRDVPPWAALFVMTIRTDVPGMEPIPATEGEDETSQKVKGRLLAWLVGQNRPRGGDPKAVNALALRRRFDVTTFWKN